eukprot:EG_transcript_56001
MAPLLCWLLAGCLVAGAVLGDRFPPSDLRPDLYPPSTPPTPECRGPFCSWGWAKVCYVKTICSCTPSTCRESACQTVCADGPNPPCRRDCSWQPSDCCQDKCRRVFRCKQTY